MPANGKGGLCVNLSKEKGRVKALARSYNYVFETSSKFNHKGFFKANGKHVAYLMVIEKFNPYRETTDTSGWLQFEEPMTEDEVWGFMGDRKMKMQAMEGSPIQNDYYYTKKNQAYSRYGTFMWLIGTGMKPKRWNGSSWIAWDVTKIKKYTEGLDQQGGQMTAPKGRFEQCSGHG